MLRSLRKHWLAISYLRQRVHDTRGGGKHCGKSDKPEWCRSSLGRCMPAWRRLPSGPLCLPRCSKLRYSTFSCCATQGYSLYMPLIQVRRKPGFKAHTEKSAAVHDVQALGGEAQRLLRCIGEYNPGLLAGFLKAGVGASAQGRVSTCGHMMSLSVIPRACRTYLCGCAELAHGDHGVGPS